LGGNSVHLKGKKLLQESKVEGEGNINDKQIVRVKKKASRSRQKQFEMRRERGRGRVERYPSEEVIKQRKKRGKLKEVAEESQKDEAGE